MCGCDNKPRLRALGTGLNAAPEVYERFVKIATNKATSLKVKKKNLLYLRAPAEKCRR